STLTLTRSWTSWTNTPITLYPACASQHWVVSLSPPATRCLAVTVQPTPQPLATTPTAAVARAGISSRRNINEQASAARLYLDRTDDRGGDPGHSGRHCLPELHGIPESQQARRRHGAAPGNGCTAGAFLCAEQRLRDNQQQHRTVG